MTVAEERLQQIHAACGFHSSPHVAFAAAARRTPSVHREAGVRFLSQIDQQGGLRAVAAFKRVSNEPALVPAPAAHLGWDALCKVQR